MFDSAHHIAGSSPFVSHQCTRYWITGVEHITQYVHTRERPGSCSEIACSYSDNAESVERIQTNKERLDIFICLNQY